jgi:hypothetical protein
MTQEQMEALLRNHGEQLANLNDVLIGMAKLVECVRNAQNAHQVIFEGLHAALKEKGMLPPDEPPAVN